MSHSRRSDRYGLQGFVGSAIRRVGLTTVEQDFHKAEHERVVDLEAGDLVFHGEMERAKRWKRGKST